MRALLVLAVIAFVSACVGGWIGWRRKSLDAEVPPGIAGTAGMLGRGYTRFVQRQRQHKQAKAAFIGAVVGAVLSIIIVVIIATALTPRG
jgi:hypothetical protein